MFDFFNPATPDDVAIVAAFLGGIGILIFGYAAFQGIKNAVKVLLTPTHQMAKRN